MFKKTSSNSLQISNEKGCLKYNGQEMPGVTLEATIKAIYLGFDHGDKETKIKAGEKLKIEIEGTDADGNPETANFYLSLNNFSAKKFLCLFPNLETPYFSLAVKPGSMEKIPAVLLGFRQSETAQKTIWCKQKFSFDDSGDLFDKVTKETTTAADILQNWADLMTIPFIDTRESDKAAKK